MMPGGDLMMLAALVQGLVVLGTLVVVGKAVIAYRQHDSRPMLLLAAGLFLLLVAPPVFEIVAEAVIEGSAVTQPVGTGQPSLTTVGSLLLVEQLIRLAGVGALLASLYVQE